ncbi:MAG: glutamine-hydrolyzing carbamoyl-phosphate synthase small subunit [Gammaproteobacteria bacterium]
MTETAVVPAVLAFADGEVFFGVSAGFGGGRRAVLAAGEVVFNTAITGYQEILTDPSYDRQIIVFTHPHIGNTGITAIDDESPRIFAAAMAARAVGDHPSSWRAELPLRAFLHQRRVPAISGLDTRAITRKLRDRGAIAGCVAAGSESGLAKKAIAAAQKFAGLDGALLADAAGGNKRRMHLHGEWDRQTNDYVKSTSAGKAASASVNSPLRVVVLDCGVKKAILHSLAARGCRVVVLPYRSGIAKVIAEKPHGVLFSNGPGDPQPCAHARKLAEELLIREVPLFGLCLGHQIIATAMGAKTTKMKFGHHGANHPVRDEKGKVLITSQNHGFAVDAETLPPGARITHTSLFDGTLQGFAARRPPVMTFQGHPEASPGPRDSGVLFDAFVKMMTKARRA